MEYILIKGERVQVPPDVVSEGREAVAAWHAAQLKGATSSPTTTAPKAREE